MACFNPQMNIDVIGGGMPAGIGDRLLDDVQQL